MKHVFRLTFLGSSLLFVFLPVFGLEPYDVIEALLPHNQLPRVLNSSDVNLNPNDPEPLFSPVADFNQDGVLDIAISGVYGLPVAKPYFLLVGTERKDPIRYEKLFFKEFDQPVFLHKAGTTGEKDPGNQAFSFTPCSSCSDGTDLYWNPEKKTFDEISWVKRTRRYQQLPHIPELDLVPQETVDKALKIVGDLPDVRVFVAGLKKAKKELATRATAGPLVANASGAERHHQVYVEIFEKKKKGELLYDNILVDTEAGVVVRRQRAPR